MEGYVFRQKEKGKKEKVKQMIVAVIGLIVILALVVLAADFSYCPVDKAWYRLGGNATLIEQMGGSVTICHDDGVGGTVCHSYSGGIRGLGGQIRMRGDGNADFVA